MAAQEPAKASRGRSPAGLLFWSGVGLAPVAALLLLIGNSDGPLRMAAVLAILAVVLIGLSITLRGDEESVRLDLEESLLREIDGLRRELGLEGDRTSAGSVREQVRTLQAAVEALEQRLTERQPASGGAPIAGDPFLSAAPGPAGVAVPPPRAGVARTVSRPVRPVEPEPFGPNGPGRPGELRPGEPRPTSGYGAGDERDFPATIGRDSPATTGRAGRRAAGRGEETGTPSPYGAKRWGGAGRNPVEPAARVGDGSYPEGPPVHWDGPRHGAGPGVSGAAPRTGRHGARDHADQPGYAVEPEGWGGGQHPDGGWSTAEAVDRWGLGGAEPTPGPGDRSRTGRHGHSGPEPGSRGGRRRREDDDAGYGRPDAFGGARWSSAHSSAERWS
jgi:hypothetical protein